MKSSSELQERIVKIGDNTYINLDAPASEVERLKREPSTDNLEEASRGFFAITLFATAVFFMWMVFSTISGGGVFSAIHYLLKGDSVTPNAITRYDSYMMIPFGIMIASVSIGSWFLARETKIESQYRDLRDAGIKTLEKDGKIRKVFSTRPDRELTQIDDFNRSLIRSNLTLESPDRQNGSQELLDALHAYVTYTKISNPVASQEKFSLMKPARGTPEWRIAKLYEDQLDTKIDGLKTLAESIDKLRKVSARREALAIERKAKIASQSMV